MKLTTAVPRSFLSATHKHDLKLNSRGGSGRERRHVQFKKQMSLSGCIQTWFLNKHRPSYRSCITIGSVAPGRQRVPIPIGECSRQSSSSACFSGPRPPGSQQVRLRSHPAYRWAGCSGVLSSPGTDSANEGCCYCVEGCRGVASCRAVMKAEGARMRWSVWNTLQPLSFLRSPACRIAPNVFTSKSLSQPLLFSLLSLLNVKLQWRMDPDDVTIREQNFHSQVREYIVSSCTCIVTARFGFAFANISWIIIHKGRDIYWWLLHSWSFCSDGSFRVEASCFLKKNDVLDDH